jgi:hypothetical protein
MQSKAIAVALSHQVFHFVALFEVFSLSLNCSCYYYFYPVFTNIIVSSTTTVVFVSKSNLFITYAFTKDKD